MYLQYVCIVSTHVLLFITQAKKYETDLGSISKNCATFRENHFELNNVNMYIVYPTQREGVGYPQKG